MLHYVEARQEGWRVCARGGEDDERKASLPTGRLLEFDLGGTS